MGTILALKQHKIILFVIGLLVLGGVATGGIAMAGGFSAQPEPAPAPKAATLPAELSAHFAALSDSVGNGIAGINGADSATKNQLEASTEGISAQFGVNASLAREVTYGQSHLWIVPGSVGICLQDLEAGAGVCGPISHAIAGKTATDVGGDEHGIVGGGTIYGLAPNGNSKIVVHDANGNTEDVPVEHNVYIITHPGAVSIEVVDSSGKLQTTTVPG